MLGNDPRFIVLATVEGVYHQNEMIEIHPDIHNRVYIFKTRSDEHRTV